MQRNPLQRSIMPLAVGIAVAALGLSALALAHDHGTTGPLDGPETVQGTRTSTSSSAPAPAVVIAAPVITPTADTRTDLSRQQDIEAAKRAAQQQADAANALATAQRQTQAAVDQANAAPARAAAGAPK